QASRAIGPHRREAVLAQDLQLPRDGRLRDPELLLDDRADRAGGPLAAGQQLEDPAAHRVAEHVERMHAPSVSLHAYISGNYEPQRRTPNGTRARAVGCPATRTSSGTQPACFRTNPPENPVIGPTGPS